jgi:hypothetical protein
VQVAVAQALRDATAAAGDRLVAARVIVRGACAVHDALARDTDRLRWDVVMTAAEVAGDRVWVEKVTCATRPLAEAPADGDDAYAALLRCIRDAAVDEDLLRELTADLAPLAAKLPPELRRSWDPGDPATIATIVDEVERLLPPRLLERPA